MDSKTVGQKGACLASSDSDRDSAADDDSDCDSQAQDDDDDDVYPHLLDQDLRRDHCCRKRSRQSPAHRVRNAERARVSARAGDHPAVR